MANHILLERIELNASAASVTFANIPQTGYTDLKIVCSVRTDRGAVADTLNITFNNGTTYAIKSAYGNSALASVTGYTASTLEAVWTSAASNAANVFGSSEIYITNYLSSNAKVLSSDSVTEDNSTTGYQVLVAGLSSSTSAINSITLTSNTSSNIVAGSSFALYGIADVNATPAIAPKASGGNIQTDGTYWYHTFLSSGTFTPAVGLSCDLLVIGAGAGGAKNGGGGAGVLTYSAANSLTATSYTVTVGAGGAGGGTISAAVGTSGGASSINSISGAGGTGGRGVSAATNPLQGGDSGSFTGGAGAAATIYRGGGGGAGTSGNGTTGVAAGSSGNNTGGAGGIGSNTYSSWASATSTGVSGYYASGGGGGGGYSTGYNSAGGSASSGGGGAGGAGGGNTAVSGTVGTANTGGGGGGGGVGGITDGSGVAGGSGIVIIRYTIA